MVNYRFYILNRHDHITNVQVLGCEGAAVVERTAHEVLDKEIAAAAIEVWDREHRVCRVERIKVAS